MPGVRRTNSKAAPLTEAAELMRAYIRENIDAFIETQIKVVDERAKLVPFKYRYGQRLVADIQKDAEKAGRPLRAYILKSRQIGITTQTVNRNFVKCLTNDNRRCVTVAHLETRAQDILNKVKGTYNRLPEMLRFELAQDSKVELGFADFGSKMFIVSGATIKSIELARGDTVQDVHASEITRWADVEHALFELQQVCHMVEGTSILIETTGRAFGSYAHQLWDASKKGKTPYVAKFLAWQDDPDCNLDDGWTDYERDRRMMEVWEYEPALIERAKLFNLKPGCIWWSYLILRDNCLGNWEMFLEDYPCSEDEAWRSRGQLYFSSNSLTAINHNAQDIPSLIFEIGMSELEDGFKSFADLRENPKLDIDDDDKPHLIVWARRREGRRYVIGGDSSAGNVGSDPSSIFVIDMITGEMMCEFHGCVKPHQTGRLMDSIGRLYNIAKAAPEINNQCGLSTLQELQRLFYPEIYIDRKLDDVKQKLTNKAGWYTSNVSRNMMLSLMSRVVEGAGDGAPSLSGAIRSKGWLKEARTFIQNANTGKPEAQTGCHDDRIIALAICWMVAQIETKGWKEDIISVLRPTQLTEADSGLILAKNMTVDEVLQQINNQMDNWRLGDGKGKFY